MDATGCHAALSKGTRAAARKTGQSARGKITKAESGGGSSQTPAG